MSAQKYNEEPDNEDNIGRLIRRLDLQWHLRSPYFWGLLIAVLCGFVYLLFPIASNNWSSWNPGPLHSGHAMIANDCNSCHTKPFQAVEDSACASCHQVSEHAKLDGQLAIVHNSKHLELKGCVDCHVEHRGENAFIPRESKLCADCHSDLTQYSKSPESDSFASFADHSEFALTLGSIPEGSIPQSSARVRMSDKSALKDLNPLAFNHAVHMKEGLKSPEGKVSLTCEGCHQFPHAQQLGTPITFEKNCRSCHELSFDDRLPNSKVPHGDSEAVYHYLLGEYSKLLGVEMPVIENKEFVRALPGKSDQKPKDNAKQIAAVMAEARSSERVLFTNTSCQLCHSISEKEDPSNLGSKFEVKKPNIPQRWFTKAHFSHSAHEIASCESCHDTARNSKETTDVLLPGIQNCRSCHVEQGHKGLVPSDCSSCHDYHGAEPLRSEKKKSIEQLLSGFRK